MTWILPFLLGTIYAGFGFLLDNGQLLVIANIWMGVSYIVARK